MTSRCAAIRLEIAAYADDELGVDAAIVVERHLQACPGCRKAVARQRHLTHALRELHPTDPPPFGLETRIRTALFGRPPAARRRTAIAAAGFAVASVLGWWGGATLREPAHHDRAVATDDARAAGRTEVGDVAPLVTAAAAIHRRIDDRLLALEVTSGDVPGVNAWLHARLPFPAAIGSPGSPAIAMEGATVVRLADRPAGLVRYRMHGRAISLLLLSAPAWSESAAPVRAAGMDFRVFRRGGLDVVGWSHAGLSYLLISDDGLATGDACAACHGQETRGSIAEFVRAVAGRTSDA